MAAKAIPAHLKVPWGVGAAALVYVLAWIGLPVLVVLIAIVLAPSVPLFQTFLDGINRSDITASFILVLLNAASALALVWYYLRRYHQDWSIVGWRRVNVLKAIGYLLAIFVGFVLLSNLVLWLVTVLVPSFNANQPQANEFLAAKGPTLNLALIALVLIPPIIEETVFRGFIFPAFAGKIGVIWGAVVSSLLFGLAHLQANVSIYTFLLGLLLCFMYLKLKSIYPGMALHMVNNFLAFYALTHK